MLVPAVMLVKTACCVANHKNNYSFVQYLLLGESGERESVNLRIDCTIFLLLTWHVLRLLINIPCGAGGSPVLPMQPRASGFHLTCEHITASLA